MRNITPLTISAIDNLVASKMDWSILELNRSALDNIDGSYRLFVQLFNASDVVVYTKEMSLPQATLNAFINQKDEKVIDNYVSGLLNVVLL
jgi:hypothetical protein